MKDSPLVFTRYVHPALVDCSLIMAAAAPAKTPVVPSEDILSNKVPCTSCSGSYAFCLSES